MWETQSRKFTTSKKGNVYFSLLDFSETNIVACKCPVEKSKNGRYDMILGRDLITALLLDFKFFENVIIGGEGT